MRTRRTKIDWGTCEAQPRWNGSTLTFGSYDHGEKKEVIVTISDPWMLRHLRLELDKIAAYWEEKVKMVRP